MRSLLRTVIDRVRETRGYYPTRLAHVLANHPELRADLVPPAPCIDATSVVCWHELGNCGLTTWPRLQRGELFGWKAAQRGTRYERFRLVRPEYSELGHEEVIDDWTCDIVQLHGFSASKSVLQDFTSTDAMVEQNSREMINEISPAKLAKNLAHDEIRILHRDDPNDHFACYLWDGRLWLMNSGGSHHLAAAKYIAARLRIPVRLKGKLYVYSLNASAIDSLTRDFEMFVRAVNYEEAAFRSFEAAMQAFKATWLRNVSMTLRHLSS